MAELEAEKEKNVYSKKEAAEARAAERVRANQAETEAQIEELVEEENKKKT